MKNIEISVGYERDNTYKNLNKVFSKDDFLIMFKEDVQEKHPYLFHDNGNGKCIHISLTSKNNIEEVLRIAEKGIHVDDKSVMCLSLLWNFPRKKYNEDLMWACLSGYFYTKKDNRVSGGSNFVVSDNIVCDTASLATDKIIEYINQCLGRRTS